MKCYIVVFFSVIYYFFVVVSSDFIPLNNGIYLFIYGVLESFGFLICNFAIANVQLSSIYNKKTLEANLYYGSSNSKTYDADGNYQPTGG